MRYVQLKAPKMSAAMNSVFPAFSSDGHSLGCARREFIHTKDECSPSSCLSPQHWVVIPAREVTRGSVSCLKHDLAWHCLYVFSSKTPTDIRIFFSCCLFNLIQAFLHETQGTDAASPPQESHLPTPQLNLPQGLLWKS